MKMSTVIIGAIGVAMVVSVALSRNYYRSKSALSEATSNVMQIYNGEVAYYLKQKSASKTGTVENPFQRVDWTPPLPPTGKKRDGGFNTHSQWRDIFFKTKTPVLYSYRVSSELPSWMNHCTVPPGAFFVAEAIGVGPHGQTSRVARVGVLDENGHRVNDACGLVVKND